MTEPSPRVKEFSREWLRRVKGNLGLIVRFDVHRLREIQTTSVSRSTFAADWVLNIKKQSISLPVNAATLIFLLLLKGHIESFPGLGTRLKSPVASSTLFTLD